ncbi:MAG: DUF3365 domain-containing protein [Verrucomicrobiae bacterium]|nr:DUF3365 domain-containing protein [Verrucomicrobiae bacterium]
MNFPTRYLPSLTAALLALTIGWAVPEPTPANESDKPKPPSDQALADLPSTEAEARGRARLLNETIHGTLQVIHRDFFGTDEELSLPSQSLKDVFKELERQFAVQVRWIGVNATKSKDHEPKDPFEKAAAAALLKGDKEYEAMEGNLYRHVGAIKIQNECLKCHVPFRTTLEDRVAGLGIYIPLKPSGS